MINRPKLIGVLSLLTLAVVVLACNLSERLKAKRSAAVRKCFNQQTADSKQQTAGSEQQPAEGVQASRHLLTSDEGGFTVRLPEGFPMPTPPPPVEPGYAYAGRSYYSYSSNAQCRCRINYTEINAMGGSGKSDEQVLSERRELVTSDAYRPATLDREERLKVQNHSALAVYTSGFGEDEKPEYSRYLFVVARARVYTLQFAAEDKAELDHPEVDTYFKSFTLTGELDSQVISKPEPEYPPIGVGRAQGTIVVEVKVDKEGRVIHAKAVSGPILLRSSAQRAAMKARFAPDKVERTGILTYEFREHGR